KTKTPGESLPGVFYCGLAGRLTARRPEETTTKQTTITLRNIKAATFFPEHCFASYVGWAVATRLLCQRVSVYALSPNAFAIWLKPDAQGHTGGNEGATGIENPQYRARTCH